MVTVKLNGGKTMNKSIWHYLFNCPTFWSFKPWFKCPECSKTYRCYWDGNDVAGHGKDYCNKCAEKLEIN